MPVQLYQTRACLQTSSAWVSILQAWLQVSLVGAQRCMHAWLLSFEDIIAKEILTLYIYIYIYTYVCIYIYIYIYVISDCILD